MLQTPPAAQIEQAQASREASAWLHSDRPVSLPHCCQVSCRAPTVQNNKTKTSIPGKPLLHNWIRASDSQFAFIKMSPAHGQTLITAINIPSFFVLIGEIVI